MDSTYLDEEVGDRKNNGEHEGCQELGDEDDPPSYSRNISRELFGGVTHLFPLVTGNLGPRQSAVTDPRVGMSPRVTSGHPAKIFSVVDDEVTEGELMRVEEEGGDAEGHNREPEVDH